MEATEAEVVHRYEDLCDAAKDLGMELKHATHPGPAFRIFLPPLDEGQWAECKNLDEIEGFLQGFQQGAIRHEALFLP